MNKNLTVLLGFAMLFVSVGIAEASLVTSKIKKMHQNMTDSYYTKGGQKGVAVAIFRFDTSEKLEKMKVGNAFAEILTHYFASDPNFKVVERTELESALKEQRLGLTGAIEDRSAAKVGQLLGAKILILGSISKVGKDYQANSRMVDAETGEVLVADFTSIPSTEFEQEAEPYLVLVPERQTIGLYGSVSLWSVKVEVDGSMDMSQNSLSPVGSHAFSVKGLSDDHTVYRGFAGAGFRYFPTKSLMLDCGGNFSTAAFEYDHPYQAAGVTGARGWTTVKVKNYFNGSVNYVKNFKTKLGVIAGVGVSYFEIDSGHTFSSGADFSNGDYVSLSSKGGANDKFFLPFVRVGGEWRIQERFGINIFGNYLISEKSSTVSSGARLFDKTGTTLSSASSSLSDIKVSIGNELAFSSSLVFYF